MFARMGEKRNVYRLLVGKRQLGRPKHRRGDNIFFFVFFVCNPSLFAICTGTFSK
jgi:hypothetical protein